MRASRFSALIATVLLAGSLAAQSRVIPAGTAATARREEMMPRKPLPIPVEMPAKVK